MWSKTLVRLSGVLIAVTLVAAACGSTDTTSTADATADTAVAQLTNDEVAEAAAADEAVADEVAVQDDDSHADDDSADSDDDAEASHDDGDSEESHSHDDKDGIEVDASLPIPAVEVELTETDIAGTFAVAVSLDNFTITEENLNGEPVDNEGHLHLLVDGEKVERFFSVDHQVVVPEGEHLVEVELSANDHNALLLDGEPIRAGLTVTGAGEAPAGPAADDAAVVLTAEFIDGSVALVGEERIEVAQGDLVALRVASDAIDEIHVHGYDHFIDVGPGEDTEFIFTADIPGRFEIEFEVSKAFIAELVVS